MDVAADQFLSGSAFSINKDAAVNKRWTNDLRKAGLQYLVLGPVTDDPKQIDLMAKKVAQNFQ